MTSLKKSWYGDMAKGKARKGAVRGLLMSAENVLEKSNRVVPFDIGDLAQSGVPSVSEVELRAAVSYGSGMAERYAVVQHENLTFHHEAGRKAKYLEDVINAPSTQKQTNIILAREIRKEL